jgi:hypothetical protein
MKFMTGDRAMIVDPVSSNLPEWFKGCTCTVGELKNRGQMPIRFIDIDEESGHWVRIRK